MRVELSSQSNRAHCNCVFCHQTSQAPQAKANRLGNTITTQQLPSNARYRTNSRPTARYGGVYRGASQTINYATTHFRSGSNSRVHSPMQENHCCLNCADFQATPPLHHAYRIRCTPFPISHHLFRYLHSIIRVFFPHSHFYSYRAMAQSSTKRPPKTKDRQQTTERQCTNLTTLN